MCASSKPSLLPPGGAARADPPGGSKEATHRCTHDTDISLPPETYKLPDRSAALAILLLHCSARLWTGTYKNTAGSAACSPCASNAFSQAGNADQCLCNKGFTQGATDLCSECAAGKFKNVSGSQPCESCARHQTSIPGSAECGCDVRHRGRKCTVRRRAPPGPKDRNFQLSVDLLVNFSCPILDLNIRQTLFAEIAEFFSLTSTEALTLTLEELQQARYRSLQGQDIRTLRANANISGNWSDFSIDMLERKTDLLVFLGVCFEVTQLSMTCGQGHEDISNRTHSESGYVLLRADCAPCTRGHFKEALDNSVCIQCPRHMTTQSGGATNQAQCECEPGYSLLETSPGASSAENQNIDPRKGKCQYETFTVAAASQVATVMTITLGTFIGTAVGSAVSHLVTAVTNLLLLVFNGLLPVSFPFRWLRAWPAR